MWYRFWAKWRHFGKGFQAKSWHFLYVVVVVCVWWCVCVHGVCVCMCMWCECVCTQTWIQHQSQCGDWVNSTGYLAYGIAHIGSGHWLQLVLVAFFLQPLAQTILALEVVSPIATCDGGLIYILWWLHNHSNLSFARWSCICVNRVWAKMALFWEAYLGKTFICCALIIVYTIYTMVHWCMASIYDHGSIFTSALRALVNMNIKPQVVYLSHRPPYRTI